MFLYYICSMKIKVNTGYNHFAIVNLSNKSYVCPGWIEVPIGTTKDMIEFVISKQSLPNKVNQSLSKETWKVESSKPGKFYDVTYWNGGWNCSCPSNSFHRGDCKHIKAKKSEKKFA